MSVGTTSTLVITPTSYSKGFYLKNVEFLSKSYTMQFINT